MKVIIQDVMYDHFQEHNKLDHNFLKIIERCSTYLKTPNWNIIKIIFFCIQYIIENNISQYVVFLFWTLSICSSTSLVDILPLKGRLIIIEFWASGRAVCAKHDLLKGQASPNPLVNRRSCLPFLNDSYFTQLLWLR